MKQTWGGEEASLETISCITPQNLLFAIIEDDVREKEAHLEIKSYISAPSPSAPSVGTWCVISIN